MGLGTAAKAGCTVISGIKPFISDLFRVERDVSGADSDRPQTGIQPSYSLFCHDISQELVQRSVHAFVYFELTFRGAEIFKIKSGGLLFTCHRFFFYKAMIQIKL